MFEGNSIRLQPLADGLVELVFDRRGEAINKFDARTVAELREAVAVLAADTGLRGVLITSPKDVFIVGADITEFGATFQQSAEAITAGVRRSNEVFVALEDLPVPTVAALNGYALGGGLELALAATLRVMSTAAQVGVPEVKLGLFPGFGGTVRLARVAGLETAMRWVATGTPADARTAHAAGVVEAVAEPEALRDEALALLRRCVAGEVDWRAQVARKRSALPGDAATFAATAQQVLEELAPRLGRHQPAAPMALAMMAEGASQPRDEALRLEAEAFGRVARTQAAASLVRTFLNEQAVRKAAKKQAAGAKAPARAAVLGAGIMGGGIAFSSALAGIPVRMKDIRADQLDLGMTEAAKQLGRRVQAGRLPQAKADAVLAAITPQLDDAGLDAADLVVEAIVERLAVKQQVLAALEPQLRPDALIATNTSSLRLADIARPLARPQNLVGMHFFNPVPAMPLVEVVRGPQTSDAAVAAAVAYSLAMKKTPIVVADGPGFLVNRVLTAYFNAFNELVAEGVDFTAIDRAMESFGWPMGPAWLNDVVGMDTGAHVGDVITAGHPARMRAIEANPVHRMVRAGRLGQKSGAGFYRYERDAAGKPRRSADPAAQALLADLAPGGFTPMADEAIVERLMLPLLAEAIAALEDGSVASAAELDMALLLGVGFPAWLGGPLQYADWLGAAELLRRLEAHAAHGPAYAPPELLRQMAAQQRRFHPL